MHALNLIWTFWKKEQKKLEHQLVRLRKRMDPEAIHEGRVAIKKLRAIRELYRQLRKEEGDDNLLQHTEALFSTMGKQRDIEICLELLPRFEKEKGCKYSELTAHLKQQRKNALARTKRSLPNYPEKELQRVGLLLKSDRELNDEAALQQSIRDILHHDIRAIRDYFKKPHKLRQHLKQVYYWMELLPGEEYRRKELHQVLDDIGNWQDAEILLSRTRHFRKDYLPPSFEEYKRLKSLEQELRICKEKWRKATLRKTGSWQKKLLQ